MVPETGMRRSGCQHGIRVPARQPKAPLGSQASPRVLTWQRGPGGSLKLSYKGTNLIPHDLVTS